MKILIVTTILIAFTAYDINAQSRVDRENVEFSSKSEKLIEATGWEQNRITGEWIENQNVIADRNITPRARSASQKFNWLQFATITFEGEQYYLLVYEKPTGYYKYPNIREGWISFEGVYFFVFTSEQYGQMVNSIDLMSGETINIKSNMISDISDIPIYGAEEYEEEDLLAQITYRLNQAHYYEKCFRLNSQVVDGSEIIRFRLPENCIIEDKLQTAYFEVELEDFHSILLPSTENENFASPISEETSSEKTQEMDFGGALDMPPPPQEKEEDFFVVVEKMPELIGGLEAIQAEINYPESVKNGEIQGRVYVQFIVNKKGQVEEPEVIRGIGDGADEEALRVVKLAEFKPGKENGHPVRVQYSLPIVFQLND